MKAIAVAVTVLAVVACLAGCAKQGGPDGYAVPDTDVSPESAFWFISGLRGAEAIPVGVTDLQGNGARWMDMTASCRFSATDDVIDVIIATGYHTAEWSDVKAKMVPGAYTEGFSPEWAPEDISEKECYIKRIERENSTAEFSLVVDRERGVVYATGESNVR